MNEFKTAESQNTWLSLQLEQEMQNVIQLKEEKARLLHENERQNKDLKAFKRDNVARGKNKLKLNRYLSTLSGSKLYSTAVKPVFHGLKPYYNINIYS